MVWQSVLGRKKEKMDYGEGMKIQPYHVPGLDILTHENNCTCADCCNHRAIVSGREARTHLPQIDTGLRESLIKDVGHMSSGIPRQASVKRTAWISTFYRTCWGTPMSRQRSDI